MVLRMMIPNQLVSDGISHCNEEGKWSCVEAAANSRYEPTIFEVSPSDSPLHLHRGPKVSGEIAFSGILLASVGCIASHQGPSGTTNFASHCMPNQSQYLRCQCLIPPHHT